MQRQGVAQPTGQKVATLEVTTLLNDGTTAAVEMQVVSIADAQGNVLTVDDLQGLDIQMRQIRLLRRIAGALEQGMELGLHVANETESDDIEEDET